MKRNFIKKVFIILSILFFTSHSYTQVENQTNLKGKTEVSSFEIALKGINKDRIEKGKIYGEKISLFDSRYESKMRPSILSLLQMLNYKTEELKNMEYHSLFRTALIEYNKIKNLK